MPDVSQVNLEAPIGLSYWELFINASFVVQLVIFGLLVMSVLCWAIIFDRLTRYRKIAKRNAAFESRFWSGQSIDELYDFANSVKATPMATVFIAAVDEWRRSVQAPHKALAGLSQRLDRAMDVALTREKGRLEAYLGLLATTGSAGPFIGLFGTVWGIMTSFQSIAASKSTNIAVVAPHIAEALLATAIGLFAAIPAVMAYNYLSGKLNDIVGSLEGFADEFSVLLSRQVDERG